MTLRNTIAVLLSIIIISCSKTTVKEKDFPSIQELNAEAIYINEIIKSENIHKLKNYIIIRDGYDNSKDFFYVYKFPEFEFLYSFATRGNGPEEYLMPTVIKGTPDNLFSFRDHATDKFVTYNITDSLSILVNTYILKPKDSRFMWEINYLNDSMHILKRSDNRVSNRELWNFTSGSIIDSIPNSFDLKKKMGKDYYTIFDDYWIVSNNNRFAFSYFFIDRIEFGSIKNNKIEIEKILGNKNPPDFYLYNGKTNRGKFENNVENNIVYYESLVCGNNNIYALYAGIPWGDNEVIHSSIIEVYSWNAEPKTLLKLDMNLSNFIVDEATMTIYGFDVSNSEGVIYKYQYNE